jgi:hypothetical protein
MATTDGTKVNLSLRGGGVRLSAYVGALVAAGGPEDRIYARWTSRFQGRALR